MSPSPSTPNATPATNSGATPQATPPTPVGGNYRSLTIAQAKQLAPFHVVSPTWVPKSLSFSGASAKSQTRVDTDTATPIIISSGPVWEVELSYRPAQQGNFGIIITEEDHTHGFSGPPATPVAMKIKEHSVTKLITERFTAYTWEDQGTYFTALATPSEEFPSSDAERMIASMIGQ